MALTSSANQDHGRLGTGLRVLLQIGLMFALIAGINLLAANNPVPGLRGDWTRDSRNTLHPDTAALLEGVQDPVELVLFHMPITSSRARGRAFYQEVFLKTDLLIREAGFLSRRISVETINPVTNPDRAQAAIARTGLQETAASGNFLLVHARGRNIVLAFEELASLDRESKQIRYHGEDALYKAVAEVTRREERMVTFTQGHGELDPRVPEQGLALTQLLDREAYRIGRVDLAKGESIQPATTVLVIARPALDLSPEALAAVDEFHRKGGNMLLLIGARTPAERLRHYLETQFRLALGPANEMLYDPKGAVKPAPNYMIVDRNFSPEHPITRPLARSEQKVAVILPQVRPLMLKEPNVCDYLLTSNPGSWPDKDKPGNIPRTLDEDEKVPNYEHEAFPMAVAVDPRNPAQRGAGENSGRMVLVCSGECARSQFIEQRFGNAAFLLNAVHWLSGKDAGERIAPLALRETKLSMTEKDDRVLFWTVVVLPTVVMLGLGILVFLLRRGG
jgi:hypothetical protein